MVSRPFDDLCSADVDEHNERMIHILFKSVSYEADLLVHRAAEGQTLIRLVNSIRRKECCEFKVGRRLISRLISSDLGCDAFAADSGASESGRHGSVRGFGAEEGQADLGAAMARREGPCSLRVPRTRCLGASSARPSLAAVLTAASWAGAAVPLNTIEILGTPILKLSKKQIVIDCAQREFSFRTKTSAGRDLLAAVLQQASGKQARCIAIASAHHLAAQGRSGGSCQTRPPSMSSSPERLERRWRWRNRLGTGVGHVFCVAAQHRLQRSRRGSGRRLSVAFLLV
jgi:hypothetical protein